MTHDFVLPQWLKVINVYEIIEILQHSNKPITSMEVYRRLVAKNPSHQQHFVAFSKLLCSFLPKHGIVEMISGNDGLLYAVPGQVSKKKQKKKR
ncbi:MAG: hypothetical protein U9Q12_01600 [Patescibacteria group bacterium]|nr:hypothetical protein [Patescibacteria group bacterium]